MNKPGPTRDGLKKRLIIRSLIKRRLFLAPTFFLRPLIVKLGSIKLAVFYWEDLWCVLEGFLSVLYRKKNQEFCCSLRCHARGLDVAGIVALNAESYFLSSAKTSWTMVTSYNQEGDSKFYVSVNLILTGKLPELRLWDIKKSAVTRDKYFFIITSMRLVTSSWQRSWKKFHINSHISDDIVQWAIRPWLPMHQFTVSQAY